MHTHVHASRMLLERLRAVGVSDLKILDMPMCLILYGMSSEVTAGVSTMSWLPLTGISLNMRWRSVQYVVSQQQIRA